MRLFRLMKLFFIINLLVICSVKGDEVPFIFNYTESAEPGETIGLQGYGSVAYNHLTMPTSDLG